MNHVNMIRPATFSDLKKAHPDLLLLDVRTPEEYRMGRIPESKLLPVSELPMRQKELPENKDNPIVVYCASGGRSSQAAFFLSRMGYQQVYDMGGIMSWPYEIVAG